MHVAKLPASILNGASLLVFRLRVENVLNVSLQAAQYASDMSELHRRPSNKRMYVTGTGRAGSPRCIRYFYEIVCARNVQVCFAQFILFFVQTLQKMRSPVVT